ncbi:MAG TPA: sigma 54-interacting transcriptional regulator [Smithellaceae bacterium]|nr:sigma 54-interacting transcriptional regulator [Smithellaceae bacterium]HRV44114.1 sigma 54-interacting transcriptional regulator [Smithellaceae bacterium]
MMMEESKLKKRKLLQDINLMGVDYYEKFYQQTFLEWKKFVSGDRDIDRSIIPQQVFDSWVNCAALGLDPFAHPDNEVLTGEALEDLLATQREFIDVSRPFMKNLYRFLEGSGFMVSLLNSKGYVLEIFGDPEEDRLVQSAKGYVGACWDLKNTGNNAASAAVLYKEPVQVFGAQHYIRMYHGATGCGSPIFSSEGQLLGCLVLFGRYYRANPHTLGMTVAAANAVENELRIRKALSETRVAYSYQQTVISSIQEALIAVDSAGYVTLMNDNARNLFGFPEETDFAGRRLRDIFKRENEQFFDLIENQETVTDTEVRIFFKNLSGDFTLTCNPILSSGKNVIGKIIILNEIQRAKSMVTRMMGATANLRFEDIQGQNPRFLMTVEQARMVSRSSSNVLLLGKSGTGKDIFAQAIHNDSDRKNGPYVAINCGAIPRDLIASELFGHEEGAFTGSRRGGNQGKFELADGGTLFLDEIAETPLELQTALLRVIEDKSVLRIGGTRVRPVNVRIIFSTNKDLREEVRKGNFREDLYYRANVFSIEMIPLKDRLDDIPLLADCFIRRYAVAMKKKISRVDERVIETFMNYTWPGNVRELQNTIERMVNFLQTPVLTADLIPDHIRRPGSSDEFYADVETRPQVDRAMLVRLLNSKMPKNRIAQRMNISRATLYRKMKQFNLP